MRLGPVHQSATLRPGTFRPLPPPRRRATMAVSQTLPFAIIQPCLLLHHCNALQPPLCCGDAAPRGPLLWRRRASPRKSTFPAGPTVIAWSLDSPCPPPATADRTCDVDTRLASRQRPCGALTLLAQADAFTQPASKCPRRSVTGTASDSPRCITTKHGCMSPSALCARTFA